MRDDSVWYWGNCFCFQVWLHSPAVRWESCWVLKATPAVRFCIVWPTRGDEPPVIPTQNSSWIVQENQLQWPLHWPGGRVKVILSLLTEQIFLKTIQIRASVGHLWQLLLIKAQLHFLWLSIGACNCTKWSHLMLRNPILFLFGFILFIFLNFVAGLKTRVTKMSLRSTLPTLLSQNSTSQHATLSHRGLGCLR